MKNYLFYLSLIFVLNPFYSFGQKVYPYEKNIKVIRDLSVYKQLIRKDSTKELVEIKDFVPGLVFDIRYATKNNFTGEQIYKQARAFTRLPVAIALGEIQKELKTKGLGLIIYDAYRPYSATVKFYEVYHDTTFVASPYTGSRHNRGAAVDLSLVNLKTGRTLKMPSPFDDFTPKAHIDYADLPKKVLKNRALLMDVMKKHGFKVYPYEWWHYDFKGWKKFEIMDLSFEQLERMKAGVK